MNTPATTSAAPLLGAVETSNAFSALDHTHPAAPAAERTPMSPARSFVTGTSRAITSLVRHFGLCWTLLLTQAGLKVPEEPGLMEHAIRLWLEVMRFVPRTPGWSQNKAEIMVLIDRIMCLALGGKQ